MPGHRAFVESAMSRRAQIHRLFRTARGEVWQFEHVGAPLRGMTNGFPSGRAIRRGLPHGCVSSAGAAMVEQQRRPVGGRTGCQENPRSVERENAGLGLSGGGCVSAAGGQHASATDVLGRD
ncbi:hypothetical protein KTR9_4821 (plasmid) [Gordonia sp. KTR9]|nr:hypothetical protein KTR9_4821 [Gordonia sp. KTR9]